MKDPDEKYKLGELTADMAAVKQSQAEMKVDVKEVRHDQKEIITKIDNINAVSTERWEKRNAYVDQKFGQHDTRIEALETLNTLREASIWMKLGKSFETKLVNYVGAAIIVFVLSIAYVTLKADVERNSAVIEEVKE